MAVKTYSRARDGAKQLSPNFKVSEFACKGGEDAILIDDALVTALQAVRDHYGKPVKVGSAYRTSAYNTKIGGAKDSQHVKGTAADIRIDGVDLRDLARWIETELNPGGLGLYDYVVGDKNGFIHIDTRPGCSRWVQTKSKAPTGYKVVKSIVGDYLGGGAAAKARPTLRKGDKSEAVKEMQTLLVKNGFSLHKYGADGDFGAETETAVKKLQSYRGLVVNGTCDAKTWAELEV